MTVKMAATFQNGSPNLFPYGLRVTKIFKVKEFIFDTFKLKFKLVIKT